MTGSLLDLLVGFGLSAFLSLLAMRAGSLSLSGALGAIIVGALIYAFGGWRWYVLLLLFFFSSSFLTRFRYDVKLKSGVAEIKGGRRNFWQVIGQGGVGALTAILLALGKGSPVLITAAFMAAVAEANADTWAVEIGVLSKRKPRLITDLKRVVDHGTSGGVTVLGTLAAASGALFIAGWSGLLGLFRDKVLLGVFSVFTAALVGEHVDSVLGATVQGTYYCLTCKKHTERRTHACGSKAVKVKGLALMSNEAVNFLSTASAAIIGALLLAVL